MMNYPWPIYRFDLTLTENWLLFDSSMSYIDICEYVSNAKWHFCTGCDSYCDNEHAGASI